MQNSYHLKDNFVLTLKESSIITLFLEKEDLNIRYELQDGDYEILVFNNCSCNACLNETGFIKNANVKICYLELNDNAFVQKTNIDVFENSNLDIVSKYLGVNKKNIVFDIYNKERNTTVSIDNKVVCLDKADFSLDVIGNIVKGAKNSKCFQKSNCLTFETPIAARVLPVLNIDENDVEASHSLSSGTIDEEILFYMNARGLDKKQALGLLLSSYLMPDQAFYDHYNEGAIIKEIADKKVEKICVI